MSFAAKTIATLLELDAFVGEHVAGELPEVYWEDSHGYFQFESEMEALRAICDPFYQRFLPDVDWSSTVVRQVRLYKRYSADPAANWQLVEKASGRFGPMLMWREHGRWHAAFGSHADADARTPTVAICLAALGAAGLSVKVEHDRLDAQLNSDPHASESR